MKHYRQEIDPCTTLASVYRRAGQMPFPVNDESHIDIQLAIIDPLFLGTIWYTDNLVFIRAFLRLIHSDPHLRDARKRKHKVRHNRIADRRIA